MFDDELRVKTGDFGFLNRGVPKGTGCANSGAAQLHLDLQSMHCFVKFVELRLDVVDHLHWYGDRIVLFGNVTVAGSLLLFHAVHNTLFW